MLMMVNFEAEHSLHDPAGVEAARAKGFEFFGSIESDPRVKASGHYADGRAGFLLIEVHDAKDVLQFTGPFLDFVRFETHPVLPFSEILKVFEQAPA